MNKVTSLMVASIAMGFSSASYANGLYGTAMIGASAQAEDSVPYGDNLAADLNFPRPFDIDNGKSGAIGLGYRLNDNFRVEGRLGFRDGDFNTSRMGSNELMGAINEDRSGQEFILNGNLKSTTLTVEGIYDIPISSFVTPYVKAGIGISRNKYRARLGGSGVAAFDPFDGVSDGYYDAYATETSNEFAWNVGMGVNYAVSSSMDIFGEYQYISLGDANTGQDFATDGFRVDSAAANEVSIGLRINF